MARAGAQGRLSTAAAFLVWPGSSQIVRHELAGLSTAAGTAAAAAGSSWALPGDAACSCSSLQPGGRQLLAVGLSNGTAVVLDARLGERRPCQG